MKTPLIRMLCLLLTVFLLCGCVQEAEVSVTTTEQTLSETMPAQCLRITAATDNSASTLIPASELNGNLSEGLTYLGVSDVTIELNGESMALEQAIRDGKITAAEILAYARLDAQNGFCEETYTSENGLSCFLYAYPDLDVHIIYDVYETPDGQQHLIEDLSLYASGRHENVTHHFVDEDSEYGYFIDREDWGLAFEVVETTPTSITLDCTQSGGQQIGQLEVDFIYYIYSVVEDQTVPLPSLQGPMTYTLETLPSPIAKIKKDSTTRFTIDWSELYGKLDNGTYRISVHVDDIFDESQVHPLMKDYYTSQSYWIEFTTRSSSDPLAQAAPGEPVFDFTAPDGYVLNSESANSVSITQNDQIVGGILLTDLDASCIQSSDCDHLADYLNQLAPFPLRLEYLSTFFDNEAYISLKITDPETGLVRNQSHHIFEKDSVYFDFWVDTSVISDEERDSMFKSIAETE